MAKTYGTVVICQRCSLKHLSQTNVTHGMTDSILYKRWKSMITRCSPTRPRPVRKNYFERGIGVCPEWLEFESFMHWSLENGFSPELEIDRIDNDKGYSPDNCRWTTHSVNQCNKRRRRLKTHCIRGHELSGENLYFVPKTGSRMCRQCHNILSAISRKKSSTSGSGRRCARGDPRSCLYRDASF